MKKIIIKYDRDSEHLRVDAIEKVIIFEKAYPEKLEKKTGRKNGMSWVKRKLGYKLEHQLYVYRTKTAIIADIRMVKK